MAKDPFDLSSATGGTEIKAAGKKGELQDFLSAIKTGETSGVGLKGSDKLQKILGKKYGITFDDQGNALNLGFEQAAPDESLTGFDKTLPLLRAGMPNARKSMLRERYGLAYQEKQRAEGVAEFENNTGPILDSIRNRLNTELSKPEFGAIELSRIRSEIGSLVQTQAANRQRRVGAVLGISGLDPSMPAGAFLANRAAEEADRLLTDQLRQMNIDVANLEHQAGMQEAALASGLALNEAQFRSGLKSQNLDALGQASTNISGLIEAIIASKNQSAADRDALRASLKGSALSAVGDIAGSLAGNPALGGGK